MANLQSFESSHVLEYPHRTKRISKKWTMSAQEAFVSTARSCLCQIRANENDVRSGQSIEATHQFRVGLRRLRAQLAFFVSI